jgi:hypothetical protein
VVRSALLALRRPDVWPAADLALRRAVDRGGRWLPSIWIDHGRR